MIETIASCPPHARIARLLLVSGVMACALPGCSKGESEPAPTDNTPPALTDSERERGVEACKEYVARVCSCAERRPDDADMRGLCDRLAPGKLSSLKMVLQVNRQTDNPEDRLKTGITAQRIIGSCISEQSKLDSLGCPRSP